MVKKLVLMTTGEVLIEKIKEYGRPTVAPAMKK